MSEQKTGSVNSTAENPDVLHNFVLLAADQLNEPRQDGTGGSIRAVDIIAMAQICQTPGVTVSELAAALRRSLGTVSQRITHLVHCGYIHKTKKSGNDKTLHLYISEEGRQLIEDYSKSRQDQALKLRNSLLELCSEQEVTTFYMVLQILHDMIGRGELFI